MNKKFLGFIFASIFVLLSTISLSHIVDSAGVIITSSDLTSTSVVIKVTGIAPSTSTNVKVYPATGTTTDKQFTADLITDENGGGEASFSGLESGVDYKAETKIDSLTYTLRFSTPYYTNNLDNIISQSLKALYDSKEGTAVGEYKVGSKTILDTAVKNAEHIKGDISSYRQADIDNEVVRLQQALDTFELSKVTSSVPSNPSTEDPAITKIKSNGIVPRCNNIADGIDATTGQYKVPCDFTFFMELINNVIKFLLFVIATPLVALILMYTGYLYLTAGGNSGQVEKVKHVLLNAVVGYVIALSAWLIVNTIVSNIKLDPTINTFLTTIDK